MKDILRKEHYCYRIRTLLMKSSAYLPPPQENLEPNPPINKGGGGHTMTVLYGNHSHLPLIKKSENHILRKRQLMSF